MFMTTSNENSQQKNSTIVRPVNQKIVLQTIELISKVNPMLGADLSLQVFTTPMAKKKRNHLFPLGTYQKEMTILDKKIVLHKYGQGPRKVLFVHGWEGAASDFHKFFIPLKEAGYQAVAIDLPGHGNSPRSKLNAAQAAEIISYLELIQGPFSAIIGHSFGGFSTALATSKNSELSDIPFVSIGAPNKLKNIIRSFADVLNLSHLQKNYLEVKLEEKYHINTNDFQFSKFIQYHQGPILIVHDENDKQVPISTLDEIQKKNQQAQYIKTQKLGHNRILRDVKVIEQILDFVIQYKDSRVQFENAFKYGLI